MNGKDTATRLAEPAPSAPQGLQRSGRSIPARAGNGGPPSVLVLGAHRQALAVARSLKRAGLRIVLGRPAGVPAWMERSRDVDGAWIHPPTSAPEAFITALERHCRGPDAPDYLFPLGDNELALTALLGPFGLPATVISAAPHLLELCQDKERLLAQAAAAGVATAAWLAAPSEQALRSAATQIGFPLVIKPNAASPGDGGRCAAFVNGKARIIQTAGDLTALLARGIFPDAGVLVQRLARGPRHNLYFAAWKGELRGFADVLTLRTDRLDGTGLAVEGISVEPLPALVKQTRALVAALDYTGIGCAQFLVDPSDGSTCFLEVNARLGANSAVVVACGLDLPRLFLELMSGDVPKQPASLVGRRYAWLGGDIDGFADHLRERRLDVTGAVLWIARSLRSQCRARCHITFEWRDPWPTIELLASRLGGVLRRRLRPSAR